MSGTKSKFYVVWEGKRPGIYTNWAEAELQIRNYPNAKYKSFPNRAEAEVAFHQKANAHIYGNKNRNEQKSESKPTIACICVDAACSGNPGIMEYRGVWYPEGKQIFLKGPFQEGTNNVGEFLALVHAIALLHRHNDTQTPIYSDSITAISWVRKKKCLSKLEAVPANAELFDLIERANRWLAQHPVKNPLRKWETRQWGENPADFGRK